MTSHEGHGAWLVERVSQTDTARAVKTLSTCGALALLGLCLVEATLTKSPTTSSPRVYQMGGRARQVVEVFEANATQEVAAIAGLGIRPTQRYAVSSRDSKDDPVDPRDCAHARFVPTSGAVGAQVA